MDSNNQHGARYSLANLLDGERMLVIPDIQRDYCWGLETVTTPMSLQKCELFVEGLLRLYGMGHEATIGLLYCYEYPAGSGCVNIIDGQQRLTTLYLLMGMLYRRIAETPTGAKYRQLLVSQVADGVAQTRIFYQSKSEAMYFLTDLVTKFFLSRNGRLSEIEKSKWYFKSYAADTNARSFLGAIRSIDAVLERAAAHSDFDFEAFAKFLADKVFFLYFDHGSVAQAERAFITINTTGQPLTLAQNIRALAVATPSSDGEMAVAQQWNEMEDWFWAHRPASMDAFLRLAMRMPGAAAAEMGDVHQFYPKFLAYARCAECGADMANEFVALPMMCYAYRFGNQATDADIERLGHLLGNYTRYQKTGAADNAQAMQLVSEMPTPKIISALRMRHVPSKIINEEERTKLQLLHDFQYSPRLTAAVRRAEAHPLLKGRVAKVIGWCTKRHHDGPADFDLEKFEYYIERIYQIWGTEIDRRDDLDPVRRALLSLRHRAYPIVRRGDMVLSLCWKDYDWQRLMLDSPGLIRQLIDQTETISLEELAAKFADRNYPYYFIIRDPRILDGCRKRQLLRPSAPFVGIYYLQHSLTRWWVEQHKVVYDQESWTAPKAYGTRCLYIDHKVLNAAIDLYHCPGQKYPYRIEVFRRPDSAKAKADLLPAAQSLERPLRYDKRLGRFVGTYASAPDALHALHTISETLTT